MLQSGVVVVCCGEVVCYSLFECCIVLACCGVVYCIVSRSGVMWCGVMWSGVVWCDTNLLNQVSVDGYCGAIVRFCVQDAYIEDGGRLCGRMETLFS